MRNFAKEENQQQQQLYGAIGPPPRLQSTTKRTKRFRVVWSKERGTRNARKMAEVKERARVVKVFPSFPPPALLFFRSKFISRAAQPAQQALRMQRGLTQSRFRRKHIKSPACASLRETFLSSTCACACGQVYRRHRPGIFRSGSWALFILF